METDVAALPGQKRVISIRRDATGENISKLVREACSDSYIVHDLGRPYEYNSLSTVDRTQLTLCDMARAMVEESNLPARSFGHYALLHAVKLHNMLPNEVTGYDESPYTLTHEGEKPDGGRVYPFGCEVISHLNESELARGDKFAPRGETGLLIGMDGDAFRVLVARRSLAKITKNCIVKPDSMPGLAGLEPGSTLTAATQGHGGAGSQAEPISQRLPKRAASINVPGSAHRCMMATAVDGEDAIEALAFGVADIEHAAELLKVDANELEYACTCFSRSRSPLIGFVVW